MKGNYRTKNELPFEKDGSQAIPDSEGEAMKRSKKLILTAVLGGSALAASVLFAGCGGGSDLGDSTTYTGSQSQIERGRYLVTAVGACADCHSPNDNPNTSHWLAGYQDGTPGQPYQIGPFKTYPKNLTPDMTTGIGMMTPQQIFDAMRTGKDENGHYLAPPMPWPVLRNMTDADTWAIVAYLKHIKPVQNAVPESEGPGSSPGQPGDWSGTYANLQPLPAYPAANETSP
jgi:mono/diheme cytochrome c family protein